MKKLRYFKCSKDHITERLVEDDEQSIKCGECRCKAVRVLSAPKVVGNTTGKSPSLGNIKPH